MVKLLVAERDSNERIALEWLTSAYSLPIQSVLFASTIQETMALLEKEAPEILYLELDMIPYDDWPSIKHYAKLYAQKIICVTAETTFERAKQAIECQSIDLLVKPLEPMKFKQSVQSALSSLTKKQSETNHQTKSIPSHSYHSLFIKDHHAPVDVSFMLFKTENKSKINDLNNFLEEGSFQKCPYIFPLSDVVVAFIPKEKKDLKQEGLRILHEWEEEYTEPLAIVVIPFDEKYESIYEMYQMARKLLEVTFFIGYRQIIFPNEEYDNWKTIDPFLTPNEQRLWIEMLNEFDKEKIKQWMYEEFLHFKAPYPNPGLLRTRLTSILAQVRRFMKTYNLHEKKMEKYYLKIFDNILYSPVLYRIVQEMLLFIYELLECAKEEQDKSRMDIIEKGIHYIEKNFHNPDLSLEVVAYAMNRSPAYYSHLLMKKYGLSFRSILTNIRMNEAKKLLVETDLTIQEIAYKIGYRNANYFSKMFKEATNVTPREYRTRHKNI